MVYLQSVPAGRTYYGNYRHFIADGGLPPLLTVQGFSVDQRQIVSGGAIGLYLALPQEPRRDHPPRHQQGPMQPG
jgi:hypothetical protein